MPSGRFNSGIPATHDKIKGISIVFVSDATRGYNPANVFLYWVQRFVGICIPPMIVINPRFCSVIIILRILFSSASVDNHCNPSLPPITINAISPDRASAVIRDSLDLSQALVSHDSQALMTFILYHIS